MTKAFAAVYAFFGALLATVGIGNAYPNPEVWSMLVSGAGLLLLSAGIFVWSRR